MGTQPFGIPDPKALLLNMNIEETSGVDHPANVEEGWLLMKQAGINSVEELTEALLVEQAAIEHEQAIVKALDGLDLTSAPHHISAAVSLLERYLKSRYEAQEETPDGDETEEENQMPASSHVAKTKAEDPPATDKDPNDKNADPAAVRGVGTEARATKALDPTGHDPYPDNFGAHSASVPTSTTDNPRPSFVESAVARVLGRRLGKAAAPTEIPFDGEIELVKALQAVWPEFCGTAATILKSKAPVPVRKAAMQIAFGNLIVATQDGFEKAQARHEYETLCKRKFSAEQRRSLASAGKAKPDGSYPVVDRADLKNAIQAWGRGGATASDKQHIIARAKALHAEDMLPDTWK